MKYFFLIVSLALFTCSCGNQSADAEETKSLSDRLFDEVIAGHDVAMPKIAKLERMLKQTRQEIDSINKLPAAKQNQLTARKSQLYNTLKELEYGDSAMTRWMNEFKYDSFKNNEPERIKYLQSELEKVNKMKDAVLSGISKADSIFAR